MKKLFNKYYLTFTTMFAALVAVGILRIVLGPEMVDFKMLVPYFIVCTAFSIVMLCIDFNINRRL